MKKLFLYFLFAAVLPISIMAQKTGNETKEAKKAAAKARVQKLKNQEEEGALIYQKETVFGIKLNTDGYGIFFEKSKLKTAEKASFYNIELGERRDSKEQKISPNSGGFFSSGNQFVFGKINNFYYLKLGVGQSLLLGGKGNNNGVSVSLVYGGGVSLALLKPYYLDISTSSRGDSSIRYMDNKSFYDSLYTFSNNSLVTGSGGFFKGIGNVKVKPGLYAKTGLRFDYGKYNEVVSALEVGLSAEYYFGKVPILLLVPEHQFFISAFVAIEFGKRK